MSVVSVVIRIFIIIQQTTAIFQDCTVTNCTHHTLTCDQTASDCILLCNDDGRCLYTTYYCNSTNNLCKVVCDGYNACQYMEIFSSASHTQIICDSPNINSNQNSNTCAEMNVVVNDPNINANMPTNFNITCNDQSDARNTCQNMNINISSSGLNSSAYMYCGHAGGTGSNCKFVNFYCNLYNNLCEVECETHDIYSASSSTLFCNAGMDKTCITNNPDYFQYAFTYSPTVITVSPTVSPTTSTLNPSKHPTQIPTNNPSTNPSKNPSTNPSKNPSKDPTIIPTIDPTSNPTIDPTSNPTIDPTSNPTVIPSNNPTIIPTDNPTYVPLETTQVVTEDNDINCELIGLNITISSPMNRFYDWIKQNDQVFGNLIKNTTYNAYGGHDTYDDITAKLSQLKQMLHHNDTLLTSYTLENCDIKGYNDLVGYYNSDKFYGSFSDSIMTFDQDASLVDVNSVIIYRLPHPVILNVDIRNPVSLILFAIFTFTLFTMVMGICQSNNPSSKLFICCNCVQSDNFHYSRVLGFIIAMFLLFNNLNTSYAYFYAYFIYVDRLFIIFGMISLLTIIVSIFVHSLLIKQFEKELIDGYQPCHVESWLKKHKFKLIFAIIVTSSFYGSLAFFNSNLFGFSWCSMRLSDKELSKYKIHSWLFILILTVQLINHCFAVLYVFDLTQRNDFVEGGNITYITIIAIISCMLNILKKVIVKCITTDFEYETITIDVRIEIDPDNVCDKNRLQERKHLTKYMKTLIAKMLEVYSNDVEVLNAKDIINGIVIECLVYERIKQPGNKTQKKKSSYAVATVELQKQLLLDDYELSVDSEQTDRTFTFEQQLSRLPIKEAIQKEYGLQTEPRDVSYTMTVKNSGLKFSKQISTTH